MSLSQRGLPRGLSGKESPCNADKGIIPESGRSLKEGVATHSNFLSGESHGQGAW